MEFIKNNKKIFIGILIGFALSSVTVYAVNEILFTASQISFDNTRAGLIKANGDAVETVEEAIDALKAVSSGCESGYTKQNVTSFGYECVIQNPS